MIIKYKCFHCYHEWLVSAEKEAFISANDKNCDRCGTDGDELWRKDD